MTSLLAQVSGMDLVNLGGQWGIASLFFVMWHFERKDRLKAESQRNKAILAAQGCAEDKKIMIGVIQSFTEALNDIKRVVIGKQEWLPKD